MRMFRSYFLITILSSIFSLYAFESFITYKQFYLKIKSYEKNTGKTYDTRTTLEVFNGFKDSSKTIVVPPSIYLEKKDIKIQPFSGKSFSETLFCNENGYWSTYLSDRYGFNNPDSEWNKNEVEYILLGDSFVHGACVNRPRDMASILRKLSKKTILNLGYSGNSSLIEYATLREYLKPNVKKVLWFYYENDLLELDYELNSDILKNYIKDINFSQNLINKQSQINKMVDIIIEEEKKEASKKEILKGKNYDIKFTNFIKLYNSRKLLSTLKLKQNFSPHFSPQYQIEFEEILKLSKDLVESNNSELFFIYLPSYKRYTSNYNDRDYLKIKSFVNKLNIVFIDVHSDLFAKENNILSLFPFENNGHYTAEGYKKISELIYSRSTK